jgi:hypothetical protein
MKKKTAQCDVDRTNVSSELIARINLKGVAVIDRWFRFQITRRTVARNQSAMVDPPGVREVCRGACGGRESRLYALRSVGARTSRLFVSSRVQSL